MTPQERPAHRKILEQAVADLTEHGFDRFSVQRVLDGAGVSRATLYRHFPDVDGLIEIALVEMFRQQVDVYLGMVAELLSNATDRASFRTALRSLLEAFGSIPSVVRLRRAHTIVLASTRPELGAAVSSVQEALTDGWERAVRESQERGFLRAELHPRATAVMLQAIGIGRLVDDVAITQVSDEQWATSVYDFIDRSMAVHEP